MIVAVMQPYFFPYIGYFQLMAAVDTFVFLDDVQYVERAWMNRNRIRRAGRACWLSMPVISTSRDALINERKYVLGGTEHEVWRKLEHAYKSALFFDRSAPLLRECLFSRENNVAAFNANLLREVFKVLGRSVDTVFASAIRKDRRQPAQAGIIEICRSLGASRYINAVGGVSLYSEEEFERAGVELRFLRTRLPPVSLEAGGQAEHLSIIDWLMTRELADTSKALAEYDVLKKAEVPMILPSPGTFR